MRYNPNGTLDAGFGNNGTIIISNNTGSYGQSILQPDGKIVVGGRDSGNFALARYNADGTLDTTFGTNGRVTTTFASQSAINDLIVQPDGKIIAVGFGYNAGNSNDFAIVRYNSNGALDAAFGEGGKVIVNLANGNDFAASVVLQPDGKIVIGGTANSDFGLVRLLPNGALDLNFGTGGIVTTDISSSGEALYDLALQPDGKIIASGRIFSDGIVDNLLTAVVRYHTDGYLDTSFAENGVLFTGIFNQYGYMVEEVAIQPNGKILAVGLTGMGLALARFNTNGTRDVTFGTNGVVITPSVGGGNEIALSPDGKILVAGGITLVRYLGDSLRNNEPDSLILTATANRTFPFSDPQTAPGICSNRNRVSRASLSVKRAIE